MSKEVNPKEAVAVVTSGKQPVRSENVMDCARFMLADIAHGRSWPVEVLAKELQRDPNSAQFGFDLSEVNRMLEQEGYHLTSRGKHGQAYFVEPMERTGKIARGMNADALRLMRRAVLFLHGTITKHGHKMEEAERRRLEKQAETQAIRYVLVSRLR